MNFIPDEILVIIFIYTTSSYNYHLYRTCKRFRKCLTQVYNSQDKNDLLACLLTYPNCYLRQIIRNSIFLNSIEVLRNINMNNESDYYLNDIIRFCCKQNKFNVLFDLTKKFYLGKNRILAIGCLYRNYEAVEYALSCNPDYYRDSLIITAANNDCELFKRLLTIKIHSDIRSRRIGSIEGLMEYIPYDQILPQVIINGNTQLFCYIINNLPYHEHRKLYRSLLRKADREKKYAIAGIICEMQEEDRLKCKPYMKKKSIRMAIRRNNVMKFHNRADSYDYEDYQKEYDGFLSPNTYKKSPEIYNIILGMKEEYLRKINS